MCELLRVLVLAFLPLMIDRWENRPLSFDESGNASGTGEQVSRYRTGEVMGVDEYVKGEIVRSRWFTPAGELVHETNWDNGAGDGVLLNEDGSIRALGRVVNCTRDGEWLYLSESGSVSRRVVYEQGQVVSDTQRGWPDPDWKARVNSAVPEHPLRERMVGVWVNDESFVEILRDEGGVVRIGEDTLDPRARSFISNVTWVGDELRYELRMEFDFIPSLGANTPVHRTTMTLSEDGLTLRVRTEIGGMVLPGCVLMVTEEEYRRGG